MWNLISGLKTLRENSVQIFLLAIWSLDVLKRIVKIFPKILLNKEIKKAGLQFNPGLVLISLWTTGPRTLRKFIPGSCRWDWSKYVTSSVAPFHEVSFRHLVGKGSNLLLFFFLQRFHREQDCPCVKKLERALQFKQTNNRRRKLVKVCSLKFLQNYL